MSEKERFEARDEAGESVGVATYQVSGNIVVHTHTTFTDEAVGSALARAAMDDARARGRTVVPMCPFLSEWLDKHPEYAKIVARSTRRVR